MLPILSKIAQRRNNFIGLFFVLFFTITIGTHQIQTLLLTRNSTSNSIALENFAAIQPIGTSSTASDTTADFYVPAIAVIKKDELNPGDEFIGPCSIIDYTYEVTNQSTANEILEDVSIIDPGIVNLMGPISGDNGNGFLEVGETWTFTAQYVITIADQIAGQVGEGINARVTANVQGAGVLVIDDSDDDSEFEDDPTVTDLSSCDIKISLVKEGVLNPGDEFIDPCTTIDYTYYITNESTSGEILEDVTLSDPSIGFIIGPDSGDNGNGLLEVGETWTYTAQYVITPTDKVAAQVGQGVNATVIANVRGAGISVNDESDDDSEFEDDPTVTDLSSCDIKIGLVKEGVLDPGNEFTDPCTAIHYTYYITNESNSGILLEFVELTDIAFGINALDLSPNPGDTNFPPNNGLLEMGETWTYTVSYPITPADRIAGQVISSQARVRASPSGGGPAVIDLSHESDPLDDGLTITDISECQPQIGLVKTGLLDPAGFAPCTTIGYTFEVTNQSPGGETLENIELIDPLLFGGGVFPILPTGDDFGDGKLEVGGETWVYIVEYTLGQDDLNQGQVQNQASVTATISDGLPNDTVSDFSNETNPLDDEPTLVDISSCQIIDLGLTLATTDFPDTDADGCPDTITYTYEALNNGNVDLEFDSITDILNNTINIPDPNPGDINDDAKINPGETWIYTSSYDIIQDNIDNSPLNNQATINTTIVSAGTPVSDDSHPTDFDNDGNTVTDLSGTCAGFASIGFTKEADINSLIDDDGDGCLDAIQYTFRVSNEGSINLVNIVLNDDLQQLGNNVPGPSSGDNGDGILGVDEVWVYTGIYDLTETDVTNGTVTGQAGVFADAAVGVTISDLSHPTDFDADADTTVDVTGTCFDTVSIGLTKTDTNFIDSDSNGCDDQIEYTITVENLGGMNLQVINLFDEQLNDITAGPFTESMNPDGVLEINENWVYTGIYNITELDVINGSVAGQTDVTAQPVGTTVEIMANDAINVPIPGACADNPTITVSRVSNLSDTDGDNCFDTIDFTITVTNTGNVDLDTVSLDDDQLGNSLSPDTNGNGDNILDMGESWTYSGSYDIIQDNIENTPLVSGANVTAEPIGSNIQISDSDQNNIDLSGACADTVSISVLREAPTVDTDFDSCDNAIDFTISITNNGMADLENVSFVDTQLNNGIIITGPYSGDGNLIGILEVNETWTYTETYDVSQFQIDNSPLIGQTDVTANPINSSFEVTDLSDPSDPLGNAPNNVDLDGVCDTFAAAISITLSDSLSNTDTDACDDAIIYTYTVTNTGSVDLDGIMLTDDLGNSISAPNPNPGDLDMDNQIDPLEAWVFTALYDITQNNINNSPAPLSNQAHITMQPVGTNTDVIADSNTTGTDVSAACDDTAGITVTRVPSLSDTDGDNCPDTINFTITVTNSGQVDLDTVSLDDDLLGNSLSPDTNGNGDNILNVNEQWIYTGSHNIIQDNIDNTPLVSGANVTAEPIGSSFEISGSDQNNIDLSGACADTVGVDVTLSGTPLDTGNDNCPDVITYTYLVSNTGLANLDTMELTDLLNNTILLENPNTGDLDSDGILDPLEVWEFNATYNIEQNDIDNSPLDNQVTVTAEHVGSTFEVTDIDQNSIDVSGACDTPATPAIGLTKQFFAFEDVDSNGCSDAIVYTYSIQNLGNEDITNIAITDTLLGGSNLIIASGDEGSPNVLDVNETWIFELFRYSITPEDIIQGEVATQASVSGLSSDSSTQVSDQSDDNTYAENDPTTTSVVGLCPNDSARIGLKKTGNLFDSNNDGCFDAILYLFTVENLGNIALENILLEDDFLNAVLTQPNTRSLNEDDILDVDEQWTYNLVYNISQTDINRTYVENQAMVSAFRVDSPNTIITDFSHESLYTEDEPTIVSVAGACINNTAGIGLIKQGSLFDANNDSCPENILYTFTVANLGNQPLTGIVLRDEHLENPIEGAVSGDDNANGTLDFGEEWVYTALYVVTQEDLSLEQVENQATVTANVVGQQNTIVNDISDNDLFSQDDPTIVSVSDACEGSNPVDSDFKIFTGLTPNGDGINDFFRIRSIENYPDNKLQIFNRWGVSVYETKGYGGANNLFGGISFGRATVAEDRELPSGTYFYILTFGAENPGQESYTGYLYINRD